MDFHSIHYHIYETNLGVQVTRPSVSLKSSSYIWLNYCERIHFCILSLCKVILNNTGFFESSALFSFKNNEHICVVRKGHFRIVLYMWVYKYIVKGLS